MARGITRTIWVTSDKVKATITNQDTLHVETTIYRVLQEEYVYIDASLEKFNNK